MVAWRKSLKRKCQHSLGLQRLLDQCPLDRQDQSGCLAIMHKAKLGEDQTQHISTLTSYQLSSMVV